MFSQHGLRLVLSARGESPLEIAFSAGLAFICIWKTTIFLLIFHAQFQNY